MAKLEDVLLREYQVQLSQRLEVEPDTWAQYVEVWFRSNEGTWSGILDIEQAEELSKQLEAAADRGQQEATIRDIKEIQDAGFEPQMGERGHWKAQHKSSGMTLEALSLEDLAHQARINKH
jgi:hypothetical protein